MVAVKVPASTATAAIATLIEAAAVLARFVGLVVAFIQRSDFAGLPFLIPVIALPLTAFLLTAFLLKRGTRWAVILVTLLSLWTATDLFYYHDLLAWFLLVVSAVAIVACWLPSARRFAREATSLRNSSPVDVGPGVGGGRTRSQGRG